MSSMKRFAFFMGFVLGLAGFVLSAGSVLLYLLTGKLPSVETGEDGRPAFGLITPEGVVTVVKEQMERERAKYVTARPEGEEVL